MHNSIKKIILHRVNMKLKHPFRTSFGSVETKDFFIIEAIDHKGYSGFGESVAFTTPWYTEETTETVFHMLNTFLIPLTLSSAFHHPKELNTIYAKIKGNTMAKSAIEGAIWDLYAKQINLPLYQVIGGKRDRIDVGISLGLEADTADLLAKIDAYTQQGFKRVKIKIKKNKDLSLIQEVRKAFPHLNLMVDGNSAYTLNDIEHLKSFDSYDLMMIEQPLAHNDIIDHASLQSHVKTPICLDESIYSLKDTQTAVELHSCEIINIKIGRVGGITEAIKIHDYCETKNVPVWSGGMLESGIGRAHNIAISTLPQFTLPADLAGSSHYWEEDIITPLVEVSNGEVHLSSKAGIGYDINRQALQKFRTNIYEYLKK